MTFPCWRIEVKPKCSAQSPDGVGLTIDRGVDAMGHPNPAPDNTTAQVFCSTLQ
jgi:hypothetical protein